MQKNNSHVVERVSWKLDGTVLILEVVGTDEADSVTHNSFATVFYDGINEEYRLRSHLATGHYSEALFEVIVPNKQFKWTIESHGSMIVYSLSIEDGIWTEVGTYNRPSMDEPMKFFEVKLKKVD